MSREKESGCDEKTGEDVGSEKASWVVKTVFLRVFALVDCDVKRFVNQPIAGSSG